MKTSGKKLFQGAVVSVLLLSGLNAKASKFESDLPAVKEVQIGVSDAFIPGGFDSQSDAYVVVSGIFPNGCYKWKGATVSHLDSFNHEIRSAANVSQGMCLMVLIPFTQEVRLGELQSGNHNLRFLNGDGTYLLKNMKVE